jgi:hypothetical protein
MRIIREGASPLGCTAQGGNKSGSPHWKFDEAEFPAWRIIIQETYGSALKKLYVAWKALVNFSAIHFTTL